MFRNVFHQSFLSGESYDATGFVHDGQEANVLKFQCLEYRRYRRRDCYLGPVIRSVVADLVVDCLWILRDDLSQHVFGEHSDWLAVFIHEDRTTQIEFPHGLNHIAKFVVGLGEDWVSQVEPPHRLFLHVLKQSHRCRSYDWITSFVTSYRGSELRAIELAITWSADCTRSTDRTNSENPRNRSGKMATPKSSTYPKNAAWLGGELEVGAMSVKGRNRLKNENAISSDTASGLIVLADRLESGSGDVDASEFLCSVVTGELMEGPASADHKTDHPIGRMRSAVLTALLGMKKLVSRCPELENMGATLVIGWFVGDYLYFSNVGDCRLYLYRDGELCQLTTDHSVAEKLQANDLPCMQRCPTRYIGPTSHDARITASKTRPCGGDRFVFLSPGITDALQNDAIERAAQFASKPEELCDWLISAATAANGSGDLSCIVTDCIAR